MADPPPPKRFRSSSSNSEHDIDITKDGYIVHIDGEVKLPESLQIPELDRQLLRDVLQAAAAIYGHERWGATRFVDGQGIMRDNKILLSVIDKVKPAVYPDTSHGYYIVRLLIPNCFTIPYEVLTKMYARAALRMTDLCVVPDPSHPFHTSVQFHLYSLTVSAPNVEPIVTVSVVHTNATNSKIVPVDSQGNPAQSDSKKGGLLSSLFTWK